MTRTDRATGFTRWLRHATANTLPVYRLDIRRRLTLCFIFVIGLMLVGDGVLLWQLHLIRAQVERLKGVDEELIEVLRVRADLLSFYERLRVLAQPEESAQLLRESEILRTALLDETQRTHAAFDHLPPEVKPDPSVISTLESIQRALPSHLDAINVLAASGGWEAVRIRLDRQVQPLELLSSELVKDVAREVGEQRAQAAANIASAERRMFLVVPIAGFVTLLIAAGLGMAITRSITEPLGQLVEGSKALARGEFQHQVSVIGNDELARLSTVFNETARKLRELQNAQAQLAHMARLTTMGELVASIAHEVNQPLAAILANGEACLGWLSRAEPDLDEARTAVDRIVKDGKRAGDIISRIRALLKRTSMEKKSLDVNEMIQEVVLLVQGEIRRNKAALRTELADGLRPVLGDRVQLQQVMLNLIINGIEAMRPVADRPRELVIRTRKADDDQVCVAVEDSGVGLDPRSMDLIFNAFYSTKTEGMGMGLSISRSIIENHKGRLRAEANKGPGATFEFTLAEYR